MATQDETELLRQYAAEFDRIGISDEASRYFGIGDSLDDAIAELRAFPSGLGTNGFFRLTRGVDFITWRRQLAAAMDANDVDAI